MNDDTVTIDFQCKVCGGTVLTTPDNEVTSASVMSCKQCGTEFGTYGQIQEKAREIVADKIKQDFRKALSGIKGITFK